MNKASITFIIAQSLSYDLSSFDQYGLCLFCVDVLSVMFLALLCFVGGFGDFCVVVVGGGG